MQERSTQVSANTETRPVNTGFVNEKLRVHPDISQIGPVKGCRDQVVTQSACMLELIETAIQFADSDATILITGESGTGKEIFARMAHEYSPRLQNHYGRTNCAAFSDNLMESELFGHERGAFTDAFERRQGWFEYANGGTLLLDEISEIPVRLQAKLLRVLEEGEFQLVGSTSIQKTDVRVIATSNLNLNEQVRIKQFREDLYHRLNVLRLHLPPLRERSKDIPLLANHFAAHFVAQYQSEFKGFSADAMQILCTFDWPGNVRQLRNTVHRACVLARDSRIESKDLPDFGKAYEEIPGWLLGLNLEDVERQLIMAQLRAFNGSRTLAANRLGITTRTLANKLKLYRHTGWVEPDWLAKVG